MDNEKTALKQLKLLEKEIPKIRLSAEGWENPWKVLISTILSARNRDEITIPIASKLFKKYPSPEKLAKAEISDVETIIKSVNFYKNKTKNIIKTSKKIIQECKGHIPKDMDKLLEFPGVGRKTANIFLSEQGEDAIAVDTHVAYISRRLGWTKNSVSAPHKIEQDLKKLFSKRYWKKINPVLVRFGKTHTSRKNKNEILEKIRNVK